MIPLDCKETVRQGIYQKSLLRILDSVFVTIIDLFFYFIY